MVLESSFCHPFLGWQHDQSSRKTTTCPRRRSFFHASKRNSCRLMVELATNLPQHVLMDARTSSAWWDDSDPDDRTTGPNTGSGAATLSMLLGNQATTTWNGCVFLIGGVCVFLRWSNRFFFVAKTVDGQGKNIGPITHFFEGGVCFFLGVIKGWRVWYPRNTHRENFILGFDPIFNPILA